MAARSEAAYPVGWKNGRVASWLVTVDHKRIGILYIATVARLLRRGRDPRAPHARAARDAERDVPDEELVQRGHDDARHDDDLPRRRPDPRRLRQLPRAADDRRARHGVPAPERALVLALPARRHRALAELVREGRRGRTPAGGRTRRSRRTSPSRAPATARTTGSSRIHILTLVVAAGRDQLHRHDPQHARARHDVDAHAALRLGDRDVRDPPARRAAGALGGRDAAAARPHRSGRTSSSRRRAGTSCSTSTCSGSSGTPRSTSWCCPSSG